MDSRKYSFGHYSVVALLSAVLWVTSGGASPAQDKCQRNLDNSGAESSYTEQHVLDVDDVEGHQIRIFELHRVFDSDTPNCEGLKRTETWSQGYSDYVDRNGHAWGYTVTTFENGDKIFGEFSGTSHTIVDADGNRKSTYVGVVNYTHGTGVYAGIHGIRRERVAFDPVANVNIAEAEEEYWIAK